MFIDNTPPRGKASDQAEGLRQLRRSENVFPANSAGAAGAEAAGGVWPRMVVVSELPGSDAGARFAFHLARALGQRASQPGSADAARRSLLVDLAPAASRLPQAMSDCIPIDRYRPMWAELSAGRCLPIYDFGSRMPLAVAAQSALTPPALDQLPRLYEQLLRGLQRQGSWGWIVLLAVDHVLPIDRACWQAADDIVLVGRADMASDRSHAAALRSRLGTGETGNPASAHGHLHSPPHAQGMVDRTFDSQSGREAGCQTTHPSASPLVCQRRLWALPARRSSAMVACFWRWIGGLRGRGPVDGAEAAYTMQWWQTGISTRCLPAVRWPALGSGARLRLGTRADAMLMQDAAAVAAALDAAAHGDQLALPTLSAGQVRGSAGGREDGRDAVRLSGSGKKIQLRAGLRPISEVTEVFRA